MKKTLKTGAFFRTGTITVRAEGDEESRTIDLSFSSEAEYERWFGVEILGHEKGEVDLDFLDSGSAPLLVDHRRGDIVGVVEKAFIGNDQKGHATARFGKSARAEEVFQDVSDGIRSNVSVGYQIKEMELVKSGDVNSYRVTDWEPFEISIVSVPADKSVGVGRSDTEREFETVVIEKDKEMPPEENTQPAEVAKPEIDVKAIAEKVATEGAEKAIRSERTRTAEIMEIATRFNKRDIGNKAIADGLTIEQFKGIVAVSLPEGQSLDTPPTNLDLEAKDLKDYSLLRAIQANVSGSWKGAELEAECSEEIQDRLDRPARGFYVPHDILAARSADKLKRDQTVGTATAGGHLVGTDHLAGEFVEILRNRMVLGNLGARVLGGLTGNIDIPRQTGAATAYWLALEGDDTTESQLTFGNILMSPKTVSGRVDMTRRLMLQSSPAIEGLVWDDLQETVALAVDFAGIAGDGTGGSPTGILNTTGIGDVAGGTNGAAPTYENAVDLETDIAVANADIGSTAYLTNALMRGRMKKTLEFAGISGKLWSGGNTSGEGIVNGYRALASNQVPSNLTKGSSNGICSAILFGNFRDVLIGEWGVMDIDSEKVTLGDSGGVVVRIFQDMDVALRRPASFSAMQDALDQ